jgi:RNA polymerase sigma-70 factor (ECF subfamily)
MHDRSGSANRFGPEMPDDALECDRALVGRARFGDADAFATLYRRYLPRIYDFVYRRVDSRESAEDLTQTIFLRALDSLDSCRDDDQFRAWLFAIARNAVYDTWRSRHRPAISIDLVGDMADSDDSPETHAVRSDLRHQVERARSQCLSALEQEILELRLQGLNDKEIALVVGRTHGAIRTVQYRMIRKLRARVDQPDSAQEEHYEKA